MICREVLFLSSLSIFDDLHDFFYSCRVDYIAHMKQDRAELTTRGKTLLTQEPRLTSPVKLFLDTAIDFLNRAEYYSQDSGIVVLEWLSQVGRLLDATEELIKNGLGNVIESETRSAWPFDFAVYALITILERAKKTVQRNRVTLKSRYSRAREIRERTALTLAKMFSYFLMILCATMDVKEGRESPTKILSITSEALSEIP